MVDWELRSLTVPIKRGFMSLTRREWLQRAGLISVGLWLGNKANRNFQAMAQSTPRKLALLVGINQYPKPAHVLKGCVTDVQLYSKLLIHQFGFAEADVLTLTDEAATRSNIESAFTTHLSEQARSGDIVVFHFSGYGCLVRTKLTPEGGAIARTLGEQQALVPVDGWVPNVVPGAAPVFNGIYEDTLFLLLRSLLTDRVTTILDAGTGLQTSFALRSKGLRARALPLQELEIPSAAEFALQDRLLQQTNLTRDQVQAQRQAGQLPGLVLAAATTAQPTALELDWPDFSAGLFSCGLTQQFWGQGGANITVQFNRLSNQMAQRIGEIPQPTIRGQKTFSVLPWAVGSPEVPQAVGLITSTNRSGQTSEVWLGGLRAELLELCQPQSCFRVTTASPYPIVQAPTPESAESSPQALKGPDPKEVMDPSMTPPPTPPETLSQSYSQPLSQSPPATLVQLRSRRGLKAIADRLQGPPLKKGDCLAEAIRVLPKNIALTLALGSNLNRIERVDATSFISMENKSLRIVGDSQPADYVFTKISGSPSTGEENLLGAPASNSYGLASLSGTLLPNSTVARESVAKLALQRLRPTLESLLALKLLILSMNDASTLRVSATLEQAGETPQPLIRLQTPRLQAGFLVEEPDEKSMAKADKIAKILSIPSGTAIQYRIDNWNAFPVYVWLVGISNGMTLFSSYARDSTPSQSDSSAAIKPLAIQPGASVALPTASQMWKASSTAGLNQAFLFVTRQPLTLTLAMQAALLKSALPSAIAGFIPLPNALSVIQKLFEDLHQLSIPTSEPLGIFPKNAWALDIEAWSSLQFVYHTA
jgi:Caspase domain